MRRWVMALACGAWMAAAAGVRADEQGPVQWNGIDIGAPAPAGGVTATAAAWTLTAGGGKDATGKTDAFHFVFQSVTGDFSLIARLTAAGTGAGTSAGLMVRDALADNVNFVAVSDVTPSGTLLQYRTPFLPRTETAPQAAAQPVWLRLVKRGTSVSGYVAADANGAPGAWKRVGAPEPIADEMLYAGLSLSSPEPGVNAQATFDHVTLTTGTLPGVDNGAYVVAPESAPGMALTAQGKGTALAAPAGGPGQTWMFSDKGGGRFAIQPLSAPALALTVVGSAQASGTKAVLQADTGQPSQRWTVTLNANGSYVLAPQNAPGSALDDLGGNATPQAVIDIWARWAGDPHTEWLLTPVPPRAGTSP